MSERLGVLVRGVWSAAERRRMDLRLRAGWVLVAVVLGVWWWLAVPSSAAADSQCPAANPSVFGSCGPEFTLPEWGDAGGWTSPDQYLTIKFGRVLGNGREQLIGRSANGIEIWDFDTTVGQWRPAVDAQNKPMILTGFADPPSLTETNPTYSGTDWTDWTHYPTIRVADVLGDGRDQIIARAISGITVFSYTPGPGGAAGAWSQVFIGGPFSDAGGFRGIPGAAPAATIQTADLTGDGKADVFGVTPSGVVQAYEWNGSGFTQLPAIPGTFSIGSPQFSTLQASPMINGRQELWWADIYGMTGLRLNDAGDGWTSVKTPAFPAIEPCLLSETSPTPWGSSPAYYETCRVVNVTGTSNTEVVGRGVDGLDVWELTPEGNWQQLATLSALSDANGWNQQKYWASIQYANLDGSPSGQQEVVARGPNGVVAYKYDPTANQWNQLPSTNQISLTDDPWGSDGSYYGTLRLGDASGDGRQDTLIARGPYGIRTWFYGRPGQTGWSAYAASGYPAFTGAQLTAYNAANGLPAIQSVFLEPASVNTLRAYWSTANPPASRDLFSLQSTLASAAGCSGEQTFAPPQYQSCTPPSGSTGFTAQDWTTVVNELLSEAWDVQQVVGFYVELDGIRQNLFPAEGAELPAIAGALNLSAATNTPTSFNMTGVSSAMLGIAASVSYEFPEVSAAEWVASELASMFPSASPDLTSNFDGTYNQLQNVFASGISQTQKALESQSLQVRSDLNLSRLVAQLRQRGTWAMDDIGVTSASNEGFALSIYKTLTPLMYWRWSITNCTAAPYEGSDGCAGPAAGPGVLGAAPNFTAIGPPHIGNTPCMSQGYGKYEYTTCDYQALDSSIGHAIWDLLPSHCDYQPDHPSTQWTFGNCPLGVNPATSIAPSTGSFSFKENWDWTTISGGFKPDYSSVSGAAARAGSGVGGSLGRAATVRLRGTLERVRPVDMSRATVVLDRVLYDRQGVGELVRHLAAPTGAHTAAASPQLPPAFAPTTLRHTGGGTFSGPLSAVRGAPAPTIRLKLTPRRGHSLAFGLTISNVAIPVPPAACAAAAIVLTSGLERFPLTLKLRLREPGRQAQALSVSPQFTCQRDRTGAIRALTVVQPRHPKLGRGLSVRISRPRRLTVGRRATLTATVRNLTRSTAYDVFIRAFVPPGMRVVSHSRVIIRNGLIVRRLTKLRRGKAQTIRLALVPTTSGRQCTTVTANAILRTQASRLACTDVVAARRPSGGLG